MNGRARVLIAGCGYVGAATAALLRRRGDEVFGVRRTAVRLPEGATSVAIDLLDDDLSALPPRLDAVVWAMSPTSDEQGYRRAYVDGPARLLDFLAQRGDPVQRAVLVGSTSVWHRTDGADVDEATATSPADFRGRAVLDGEAVFAGGPFHSVALRFAGIYGPGRTRLLDRIASGEAAPPRRAVHGNRIWRDDGAKAIVHALTLADPDPVDVVVDDEPADLREVYAWLAERLGVALPAPSDSFAGRGGDKRCRNTRLRDSGFEPDVPDFRAGYSILCNQR
ncbi:MAG: NAD-dependent epimerase/dehydratase family protein [Planctomycetota bacterium]